jgi:hypothetical protein
MVRSLGLPLVKLKSVVEVLVSKAHLAIVEHGSSGGIVAAVLEVMFMMELLLILEILTVLETVVVG